MRTIWKFPLTIARRVSVEIPRDAELLSVQMQGDTPTLWAIVDPEQRRTRRVLAVYGTGWDLPDDLGRFIATFQHEPFVFHVFDLGEAP